MKEQLVYNALIRLENVPAGVESPAFEVISTKAGRILVREYDKLSPWRPSALFGTVLRELNGGLGDELKKLHKFDLHPVLFMDFNVRCVTSFRVLISAEDLLRRKRDKHAVIISTPSNDADRTTTRGIALPAEVATVLARYGFSIEIFGW